MMRHTCLILASALILTGSTLPPAHATAQQPASSQAEGGVPSDALDRRTRSNAVMRSEGVPVNEGLPAIEAESQVKPRSKEAVTMRAVALTVIALKAVGADKEQLGKLVADFQLRDVFTPDEAAFMAKGMPADKEGNNYSWRYEAAYVLFWAVGFFDRLDGPRNLCDPDQLTTLLQNQTRVGLLARAKLRSLPEILDKADLIYRYRWALVEAELHNAPPPAKLDPDVAMERHQALNWLVQDEEWDEISLDT